MYKKCPDEAQGEELRALWNKRSNKSQDPIVTSGIVCIPAGRLGEGWVGMFRQDWVEKEERKQQLADFTIFEKARKTHSEVRSTCGGHHHRAPYVYTRGTCAQSLR